MGSEMISTGVPSGTWRGSPIQSIGTSVRSASQALAATSGPIPAGSPQVMATGARVMGASFENTDRGVGPQFFQQGVGERRQAAVAQLGGHGFAVDLLLFRQDRCASAQH
mmetsp:Transcript_24061/g.44360  ORF Transcript_24061/g.44360 Transcript_24061/m.44360 type:complete len:110 (+) Transcript_24061:38-367(+)